MFHSVDRRLVEHFKDNIGKDIEIIKVNLGCKIWRK